MNKYIALSLALVAILVFSGCGLLSSKNGAAGEFTLSQSIWKSMDGGKTWEAKNKGVGTANIKDINVLNIAVDSYDAKNVFAGLRRGGILKSSDGGDSWKFLNFQSEKVYGLALDPSNGKTLYATGVWQGRGKIFKSVDAGENWEEIYTSPSAGPLVVALSVSTQNPETVFASTTSQEVIKSVDGGITWKNVFTPDSIILKISSDKQNENLVYLTSESGDVFVSKDGGEKFENISSNIQKSLDAFSGNLFELVETDPSRSGQVFLAGEGGLAASSDEGATWRKIPVLNNPQDFPIMAIAVNPQNSSELVYGSAQAAYKSVDGGENWLTFQFEMDKKVNALSYSIADPNVVFIGFSE